MEGRGIDRSRLSTSDRSSHPSSGSTPYHDPSHLSSRSSISLKDNLTPERLPYPLPPSIGSTRSNRSPHAPHYLPAIGDQRQSTDTAEAHRSSRRVDSTDPMRYERSQDDRRSASPVRSGSSVRPRSSSPVLRARVTRGMDGQPQRIQEGSGDSEGSGTSVKSDGPSRYLADEGRSQRAAREEAERYQPPDDGDGTLSSLSEPASRPRSPHKRRTRMLMSRIQWQALSRLWDKTIFPATAEREALAREIGLTPRQVQVWFQNQRQKRRRERETDAANAALVASSPYFAAARTAELSNSWSGGPHHYGEESRHFSPNHRHSHPGMPGQHHQDGFDHHPTDGMRIDHTYVGAPHGGHRQEWGRHEDHKWYSNHHLGGERDQEREVGLHHLSREHRYDRERGVLYMSDSAREGPAAFRPHHYHYSGPLGTDHRDDQWQHISRPTLSPHHSYPPPPSQYSTRGSHSPHPPWQSNDPSLAAAAERPKSPGVTSAVGPPHHQAGSGSRSGQADGLHHVHSRLASPASGRQRGASFLPPSLSVLAIDRPLDRDDSNGRLSSSYVLDDRRDNGTAMHSSHLSSHAPQPAPKPHTAVRLQHPPSPGRLRPSHPQDPRRPSDTQSPPRLPSLSSLLH